MPSVQRASRIGFSRTKGAIGVMSRRVKKAKGYATNVGSSRMSDSLIINPHALPMFRNQNIAITNICEP